jgi:superfamily II DNA or RNA helicase
MRCERSWPRRIPAEALRRVAEPLATAPLAAGSAHAVPVARAMVAALQPAEADVPLAPWLREAQGALVRRACAAIVRHGGALLAEPVGAGKTWMALAVAAALQPDAVTPVLVPAPLVRQWRRVAEELGVRVAVGTHALASAGRLPEGGPLAIVDESQHFRNAGIARYAHVARWLVGRRALLLSATPVVNHLRDLAAQLLLAVRDDALAAAGVPSLAALLGAGRAHPALGELVVARARRAPDGLSRRSVTPDESGELLRLVDALELSPDAPVRALVRRVFWRAAASSPAALAETAGRYERLLRQGADAAGAGRSVDVATLRRFAGAELEQLVMWELVADDGAATLALDDLPAVEALRRAAAVAATADDGRVRALRALLADGRASVVFTTRRATLHYLRERLDDPRTAWCTGGEAGIGRQRAPRATVLDWFRAAAPVSAELPVPRHLLATDVAAEGLDLGRAARVVHYDLPWTAARLEQREGRVRRGAPGERDVVTLATPHAVEDRLGVAALLARKAALPAAIDLAPEARSLWTWRESLAPLAAGWARDGVAAVRSEHAGLLATFTIGSGGPPSPSLVWLDERGATDEPAVVAARLRDALAAEPVPLHPARRDAALEAIAPVQRERLRQGQAAAWQPRAGREGVARLLGRLWELARRAARDRRAGELAQLQAAIRFAGGGHTAGEALLVTALAGAEPAALVRALGRLPAPGADVVPAARLVGLLVFDPLPWRAPAATFGRHDALPHDPLRPRRDPDRLDPVDPEQLPPHPRGARHPGADG